MNRLYEKDTMTIGQMHRFLMEQHFPYKSVSVVSDGYDPSWNKKVIMAHNVSGLIDGHIEGTIAINDFKLIIVKDE